ncbi:beta-ketoacyl synthase N-terminal-like domain-containing protein [Paraglaciecola sp.]|uniref:beta-ketoacyl synthase N-terminal-like domain-containing protein n=1 Tax=Paraglaciecola sp. TaxID=1920173 RepID=UPI0030F48C88
MAVYLHSSVSHTASGISYGTKSSGRALSFIDKPNVTLTVNGQSGIGFYAMDQIAVDSSESRLFTSLTTVLEELISLSGLDANELKHTALLLGSTSLDIGTLQPSANKSLGLPQIDRLSHYLQQRFALSPMHLVFNTACTASINAVIYAKKLIDLTGFKHVIVIGCEFYNQLTMAGFHSLDLLSNEKLLAFHQQRQGLILGEGIGALLLSEQKPERKPHYRILEGDSSCDTSSLTMTAEDGSHIKQVMAQAVKKSALQPSDINLVKVHGTATYNNDIAEFNGLISYFSCPPPILALKPFIGHTLGACGAIEMALMDSLLNADVMPVPDYVTVNTQDNMLPFVAPTSAISDFQYILLNHCGFGGNNAALVLETQH